MHAFVAVIGQGSSIIETWSADAPRKSGKAARAGCFPRFLFWSMQ